MGTSFAPCGTDYRCCFASTTLASGHPQEKLKLARALPVLQETARAMRNLI
jgi:hypothetical protein